MVSKLLYGAGACALAAALGSPALATETADLPEIVVTAPAADLDELSAPNPQASVDAQHIADTVNALNAEDALRYLPDILVRKRHPGDVQDPITTRTSGVGASARSLIYADGVLLSALIGNNNSGASPPLRHGDPRGDHSDRRALRPVRRRLSGNSIGAVVNFTTRMPDHFEASLKAIGSLQGFSQYGTKDDFPAGELAGVIGDRIGPWSFWLSENHSETHGQPLTYVTATQPTANSTTGTIVTGAFNNANRTAAPIVVLGASGLRASGAGQRQDQARLRLRRRPYGGPMCSAISGRRTTATSSPI